MAFLVSKKRLSTLESSLTIANREGCRTVQHRCHWFQHDNLFRSYLIASNSDVVENSEMDMCSINSRVYWSEPVQPFKLD